MFGGGDRAIPDLRAERHHDRGQRVCEAHGVAHRMVASRPSRTRAASPCAAIWFEYNWQSGQSGFAILFTVRNQDGGCPWCQVEDVLFEKNVVRHVAAGVNILGFDDNHTSLQTNGITIRNNLFADVNPQQWGGSGYFLQLLGGAADVTVDHKHDHPEQRGRDRRR